MIEKSKIRPHLSPSQISTYLRCGEMWRRRYIEGEIIPPGITLIKGRSIHTGAEINHRQKIESHRDMKKKDIIEISVNDVETIKAEDGYSLTEEEQGIGAAKVLGQAKDRIAVIAGLYMDEVAPTIQPVLVEETFRIELPGGSHDLLGRIDYCDDQQRVGDIKTASKSKNQADIDNSDQMTFYHLAYQSRFGHPPAGLRMDVLVDKKVPAAQFLTSTRDEQDYEILINKINAVLAGLKAGIFLPAPENSWICSKKFCGYAPSCRFFRK